MVSASEIDLGTGKSSFVRNVKLTGSITFTNAESVFNRGSMIYMYKHKKHVCACMYVQLLLFSQYMQVCKCVSLLVFVCVCVNMQHVCVGAAVV